MKNTKKKKTRLKHPVMLVLSIILMLGFLVAAAIGARDTRNLTVAPDNFNELTPQTSYEGQIVSGQLFASLGSFGFIYKTDENGNIISENDRQYYYLIAANNDYSMALVTDNADFAAQMDALTAATDEYRNGITETVEYDSIDYGGMLIAMTDDELMHMYSWVLDNGFFGAETAEEASAYIIPYKISDFDRGGALPMLITGCAGFAGFSAAVIVLARQRVPVQDEEDTDSDPSDE